MPLSLNEIRERAFRFAACWADETSESAEAKSFWDAFFEVFGVHRRRVATFETPIRTASGDGGFIDLLWKGVLLVEHKSRGRDLDRARGQAFDYFRGLRDRDLPRYVIVSDFARIRLYDLEPAAGHVEEFQLSELPQKIDLFGFMSGYERRSSGPDDPVNEEAAARLGHLHDLLEASGYRGHDLAVFLVRLLFCLFADASGIFEKGLFRQFVEIRTAEDGSDLGLWLSRIFDVLNSPSEARSRALDEHLAALPHVNGRLFEARLAFPDFNREMRETVLECLALNWSHISPAIFSSLFQSVMNAEERRAIGAHYTSERNVLEALGPLFLDDLRAELETARGNARRLRQLHDKLASIRVMDPACGCGNFLVVAYREMRQIEIAVLRDLLRRDENLHLDIAALVRVDVDQFYGIEVDEWPAQIAQVALWLVDHQMNIAVSAEFGSYYVRLPLRRSPTIVHSNALRIEWRNVIAPADLSYIVGNPPFIGHQ
jgi:hypothetical protein